MLQNAFIRLIDQENVGVDPKIMILRHLLPEIFII